MPRHHSYRSCPGEGRSLAGPLGESLGNGVQCDAPSPSSSGGPVPGGRFDSADGSYSYIYLARSAGGALAESFARHLDYTRAGPRPLPLAKVAGKKISSVVVKRDLRVVVAYGAGAEQLGQDMWLTTCDEDNYSLAREWAVAVRRWEPGADGLVWKSRRDPAEEVFVLWGDPSTAGQGCGLLEVAPIVSEHLAWGPAGHVRPVARAMAAVPRAVAVSRLGDTYFAYALFPERSLGEETISYDSERRCNG